MTTLDIVLSAILAGGPVVGSLLVFLLRALKKEAAANWVAAKAPLLFHAVEVVKKDAPVIAAASADQRIVIVLNEVVAAANATDNPAIVRWAQMIEAARKPAAS